MSKNSMTDNNIKTIIINYIFCFILISIYNKKKYNRFSKIQHVVFYIYYNRSTIVVLTNRTNINIDQELKKQQKNREIEIIYFISNAKKKQNTNLFLTENGKAAAAVIKENLSNRGKQRIKKKQN